MQTIKITRRGEYQSYDIYQTEKGWNAIPTCAQTADPVLDAYEDDAEDAIRAVLEEVQQAWPDAVLETAPATTKPPKTYVSDAERKIALQKRAIVRLVAEIESHGATKAIEMLVFGLTESQESLYASHAEIACEMDLHDTHTHDATFPGAVEFDIDSLGNYEAIEYVDGSFAANVSGTWASYDDPGDIAAEANTKPFSG